MCELTIKSGIDIELAKQISKVKKKIVMRGTEKSYEKDEGHKRQKKVLRKATAEKKKKSKEFSEVSSLF